jgi:hypothetical protein
VSFAAETAAASATVSGGRTGALWGRPLRNRAALPLWDIERPFRFWEIERIGDPQMRSSGAGGAGGGITPAQILANWDDVVGQA